MLSKASRSSVNKRPVPSHLCGWSCLVCPVSSRPLETRPLEFQRSPLSRSCEKKGGGPEWNINVSGLNGQFANCKTKLTVLISDLWAYDGNVSQHGLQSYNEASQRAVYGSSRTKSFGNARYSKEVHTMATKDIYTVKNKHQLSSN